MIYVFLLLWTAISFLTVLLWKTIGQKFEDCSRGPIVLSYVLSLVLIIVSVVMSIRGDTARIVPVIVLAHCILMVAPALIIAIRNDASDAVEFLLSGLSLALCGGTVGILYGVAF